MEPSPIWFTWSHIGSARTVVGMVGVMWPTSFPSTACTVTLVLKGSDGWSDVCVSRGVEIGGCRLGGWEDARSCLVALSSVALCGVVRGIRSEDMDVVQVLVAMGWRCVVVRAEHVACFGDAGIAESGLCVVVVAELRRTAVVPWGAFDVSGVRRSSGCLVDVLKAVAVLVLARVVTCMEVWGWVILHVLEDCAE